MKKKPPLPVDYIDNPFLLSKDELNKHCAFEGGYQWFYEGRNGWWLYDERTSAELEQAYKHGDKECELLIAGFLYVIDYSNMVQMRRNDPSRRRRIKRDLASIPTKGIAGLRITNDNCSSQTSVDSQGREGAYGQEHSTQASSSDNAQSVIRYVKCCWYL
ncbi:RNF146 (predicted) [Pycnogonum litorale]